MVDWHRARSSEELLSWARLVSTPPAIDLRNNRGVDIDGLFSLGRLFSSRGDSEKVRALFLEGAFGGVQLGSNDRQAIENAFPFATVWYSVKNELEALAVAVLPELLGRRSSS